MSINKFQEKVFRTGCGSAVLYVCAAVFFGGMFYTCALGGRDKDQNGSGQRVVAVEIGDSPVYYDDLSRMIDQQRQQAIQQSGQGASPDALSPIDEAQIESRVLTGFVDQGVAFTLAEKAGVKFTDQAMSKQEEHTIEEQVMMTRMQLVQQGKLKPDATDKEFDSVLKQMQGESVTEKKTRFHQQLVAVLKDPKIRPVLELEVAKPLLLDSITASIKPSPAELKASYDSYQFKRILFAVHPGSTVDSQIAKAQADLKSGSTFEQAVDRYSSEHPMKGKKLSENSIDLTPSEFDTIPDYKPLKAIKLGQVSDVIETPQGKAIYKLIAIKNMAPPDLTSPKANGRYVQQYASQKAQSELDGNIKQFMKSGALVWKIQGLKALFDWAELKQDTTISPTVLPTRMAAVVDEAKKASSSSTSDSRPAMLAWYAAFDSIWTAPGAENLSFGPIESKC